MTKKVFFYGLPVTALLLFCSIFLYLNPSQAYQEKIEKIVEISAPDNNFCYIIRVETSPGVSELRKIGKWVDAPNIKYIHDVVRGEKEWMLVKGRRPLNRSLILEYLEIHVKKETINPPENFKKEWVNKKAFRV